MSGFKKVAVLGPGLLGGSIALAVLQQCPGVSLSLWGRRDEVVSQALELGIEGATSDLKAAVKDADLVILATPVGVMPQLVAQLDLSEDFLVTDVGSVKRVVHQELEPMFMGQQASFIGSHPMAGSEKTGLSAARADMLRDAACILTNEGRVQQLWQQKLIEFWQALGMRTKIFSAEDHDYAVARISHFPHMLASVGATVGLAYEDIADLAGGGLRDTTRVAAGDVSLWTEILLENADALQRSLGECITEVAKVQEMLRTRDELALQQYLAEGKRKRELI